MAKGQHLSAYQQKIVKRYYEHADTINITRLAEAATELYLCTEAKKAEKLWASVANALAKTAGSDPRVRDVLAKKDIAGLAQIVNDLSVPGGGSGARRR